MAKHIGITSSTLSYAKYTSISLVATVRSNYFYVGVESLKAAVNMSMCSFDFAARLGQSRPMRSLELSLELRSKLDAMPPKVVCSVLGQFPADGETWVGCTRRMFEGAKGWVRGHERTPLPQRPSGIDRSGGIPRFHMTRALSSLACRLREATDRIRSVEDCGDNSAPDCRLDLGYPTLSTLWTSETASMSSAGGERHCEQCRRTRATIIIGKMLLPPTPCGANSSAALFLVPHGRRTHTSPPPRAVADARTLICSVHVSLRYSHKHNYNMRADLKHDHNGEKWSAMVQPTLYRPGGDR